MRYHKPQIVSCRRALELVQRVEKARYRPLTAVSCARHRPHTKPMSRFHLGALPIMGALPFSCKH